MFFKWDIIGLLSLSFSFQQTVDNKCLVNVADDWIVNPGPLVLEASCQLCHNNCSKNRLPS